MDRVSSGDGKKVRFVQMNDRVFAVGGVGGLTTQNGLQWCPVNDQQKVDELERHGCTDIISHDYQHQHQQLVQEHDDTERQVTKSLQISSTSADASSTCTGLRSSMFAASSQASAGAASVTGLTSWSGSQATAGWVCPSNVQPGGRCEAASVAQQIISRHQVSIQEYNGDKHMFEDGLIHLRNLYEAQLASSRWDVLFNVPLLPELAQLLPL